MTEIKRDSWYERNQRWATPLISSFIVLLMIPLLRSLGASAALPATEIPSWLDKLSLVTGSIGLAISGFSVQMVDTLSARLMCAVGVLAGYAVAGYLLVKMLGI